MVSAFLTSLIVEDDTDGEHMLLVSSLVYRSDRLARTLTVPTGFLTDFASIPRPLWALLPKHGGYDRATVLHDYCYQFWPGQMDRGDADAVLNEAMDVCGVGRFTRWIIYAGVRSGGWVSWRKYRSEQAAQS